MTGFWNRLAPRERLLIQLAGAALLAALLIQGVLVPLHKGRDAAREKLTVAEGTLSRMDRLAAAGTRYVPPTTEVSADPVKTAAGLAQDLGLASNHSPATVEGRLQFRFDGVEAPVVFTWLERVEAQTRLRLHSIDMLASGDGRVQVSVEFTGAP